MEQIKDFIFPYIKVLKQRVLDSDYMTGDEKNVAMDELDQVQENLAYQLPVIKY